MEEALEINPFEAHYSLTFLHFPTGNDFNMLAVDERDLDVVRMLNKGSKIYTESSRWSRFLGNVYRAEGDLKMQKNIKSRWILSLILKLDHSNYT